MVLDVVRLGVLRVAEETEDEMDEVNVAEAEKLRSLVAL